MKRILFVVSVLVAGCLLGLCQLNAQDKGKSSQTKRQQEMAAWKQDMENYRQKKEKEHKLTDLADSIASIQAISAIKNKDFVLEANSVTFSSGNTIFVNSSTNFISVKGDRGVVQISPSNFVSGPNGLGGVTADGAISEYQITTDRRGRVNLSFNVFGIGISAQVILVIVPGSTSAQATVYPNFNSNTLWISGNVTPYENSCVIEGSSL